MERLLNEKDELDERLSKLNAFISGERFQTVTQDQQSLLKIQAAAMKTYSECLAVRILNLQAVGTA